MPMPDEECHFYLVAPETREQEAVAQMLGRGFVAEKTSSGSATSLPGAPGAVRRTLPVRSGPSDESQADSTALPRMHLNSAMRCSLVVRHTLRRE